MTLGKLQHRAAACPPLSPQWDRLLLAGPCWTKRSLVLTLSSGLRLQTLKRVAQAVPRPPGFLAYDRLNVSCPLPGHNQAAPLMSPTSGLCTVVQSKPPLPLLLCLWFYPYLFSSCHFNSLQAFINYLTFAGHWSRSWVCGGKTDNKQTGGLL